MKENRTLLYLTTKNRRLEPDQTTGQTLVALRRWLWSYSKLIHCSARTSSLRGTLWMERVTSTRRPTEKPLLQCQLSKQMPGWGHATECWFFKFAWYSICVEYLRYQPMMSFYILNMTHQNQLYSIRSTVLNISFSAMYQHQLETSILLPSKTFSC